MIILKFYAGDLRENLSDISPFLYIEPPAPKKKAKLMFSNTYIHFRAYASPYPCSARMHVTTLYSS
jgi:hypothetical protein